MQCMIYEIQKAQYFLESHFPDVYISNLSLCECLPSKSPGITNTTDTDPHQTDRDSSSCTSQIEYI